jgi:hypothetical protein
LFFSEFLKKKNWDFEFPIFISKLEDLIDQSLTRINSKKGFEKVGLIPLNKSLVLFGLPKIDPLCEKQKINKRDIFDINNHFIDEEFLKKWEEYNDNKMMIEEVKKKKLKKKREINNKK